MKKNYLFLFLILGNSVVNAQSLTRNDIGLQVGDNFTIFQSGYHDPGANGTGVTWDLSAMNGQAGQIDVTVNNNSSGSGFPNANIFLTVSGNNSYYNITNTYMETVGSEYSGGTQVYSDPLTMLTFPVTSSTDFTDTFESSNTNTLGELVTGTIHVEFSGTGTLITPAGTFTDVVRIKQTQIVHHMLNSVPQYVDTSVAYIWYKAGFHYQLAFVQSVESTVSDFQQGYYTSATVNNLSTEENQLFQVTIYPNPASERIQLQSNGKISDLKIYDVSGELVLDEAITHSPTIELNITDLNSGIYFIHVLDENGTSSVKRFIKN